MPMHQNEPRPGTRSPAEPLANDDDPYSNRALALAATRKLQALLDSDVELRHTFPLEAATEGDADLTSIESAAMAFARYADRPCLGYRAVLPTPVGAAGEAPIRYLPELRTVSYRRVWRRAQRFATGLRVGGLAPPGTFVGICGFGSVDWVVGDLACHYLALVSVPLQTSLSPEELTHIISHAEVGCLLCSFEQLDDLEAVAHQCPSLRAVVVMDLDDDDGAVLPRSARRLDLFRSRHPSLTVLTMGGVEAVESEPVPPVLPAERDEADPLMSLMYTSGSTGLPKGAMFPESLWSKLWRSASRGVRPGVPDFPQVTLSYVPLSHLTGRFQVVRTIMRGGVIYFAAKSDMSTLFEDVRLVRPTALGVVPRVSSMIYQEFKAAVARRATDGAAETQDSRQSLEAAVLDSMRHSFLGDRLLAMSVGSAPTSPEVVSFLKRCFEVPVYESYGSTEAGPMIFEERIQWDFVRAIKLADVPELGCLVSDEPFPRGELRVKTNLMIPGYYNNEEATRNLFDSDGFLRTGDVVERRGSDCVVWIDRVNSVIKLSHGEFVSTSRLEAIYSAASRFIHQVYIYGNSLRSSVLAVVVPDSAAIRAYLSSLRSELDAPSIKRVLAREIRRIAAAERLRGYEVPRDFLVEPVPFTKENGLLTETAKLSRHKLKRQYGEQLEGLYALIERQEAQLVRTPDDAASVPERMKSAIEVALGLIDVDVLRAEHSFSQLGGDSLAAVRLSSLVEEALAVRLPVALLLDPTTSVRSIVEYVETEVARGPNACAAFAEVHGAGAEVVRTEDLRLHRLLAPEEIAAAASATRALSSQHATGVALLTGANGFLGRFLTLELLHRLPRGGRLHCIVRGTDDRHALERLRADYSSDVALLAAFEAASSGGRLVVHAGNVTRPRLGLADDVYAGLCDEVDCVVHNAALVNHTLDYRQLFEPNVVGTAQLIRFALARRLKRINYVSSVGALAGVPTRLVLEDDDLRSIWSERRLDGTYGNGYALTKWASEVLLRNAHDSTGVPVNVFRPSQVLPSCRYSGQVNLSDAVTRLLCGIVWTALAPRSFYSDPDGRAAHFDGLPVDVVAGSIAAIAVEAAPTRACATYHVVNGHWDDHVSFDSIVEWIESAGYPLNRVHEYPQWHSAFSRHLDALDERSKRCSPVPLLSAWRHPFRGGATRFDNERFLQRLCDISRRGGEVWVPLPGVSEALIHRYLDDLCALGVIVPRRTGPCGDGLGRAGA